MYIARGMDDLSCASLFETRQHHGGGVLYWLSPSTMCLSVRQAICLPCSGSGGCPCSCNYATDSTCQCRDLAQALNVTITKSAVYASYPLIYQQAFNYQPYEARWQNMACLYITVGHPCLPILHARTLPGLCGGLTMIWDCCHHSLHSMMQALTRLRQLHGLPGQRPFHNINVLLQAIIRTGGSNPITSCDDDPLSTTPTCGWATNADGNNVYASQGFCCSCTTSALAAATLTSGTNQRDIQASPEPSQPPRVMLVLTPACMVCRSHVMLPGREPRAERHLSRALPLQRLGPT